MPVSESDLRDDVLTDLDPYPAGIADLVDFDLDDESHIVRGLD